MLSLHACIYWHWLLYYKNKLKIGGYYENRAKTLQPCYFIILKLNNILYDEN